MRKIILFMHASVDGFVASPNGEMDWITITPDIFEYAQGRTDTADTALYGRVTYDMMDAYWPTAAKQPQATAHDIEHSSWYNRVSKVVVSRSMQGKQLPNTTIVGANLVDEIQAIKRGPGHDIAMFGSPSAAHALMAADLIDEMWLMVNPILLGDGIPLFKDIPKRVPLETVSTAKLPSGVVALHFRFRASA